MRTHNGNIEKVKKEIKKLTLKQLKLFNIHYHELIFGKPYADFYIDDLSVHPNENLNTKLGYYEYSDRVSRSFNEVIIGEKITIKKSKNTQILQNEIEYLENIPNKIKNLFPEVKNSGKDYYKMETINGLKLSYYLINNLLTKSDLTKIFNNLIKIHSSKKKINNNKELNIYENYLKKIKKRIKKNPKIISKFGYKNFDKLKHHLNKYEKNDKGRLGVVHGDPVLSNIIKKHDENLIFLDPRGYLGNKFSIFGDVNYDFAKLYQSLCGYENIIMDKVPDEYYLEILRNHLEELLINNKIIDEIFTIKYLSASLFLSLIDFHDKKYTNKFLDISRQLIN